MLTNPKARTKALAALITCVVATAFGMLAAPPAHAYQSANLCIVNHTAGTFRVNFFRKVGERQINDVRSVAQGGQECKQVPRRDDGPAIGMQLQVGERSSESEEMAYTPIGVFMVHNRVKGSPVIVGRLQSSSRCSLYTYPSTCWTARLGQNQHRCLQENGYWVRPSREADSGGATQLRIQVHDRAADPSTFGC